MKNKKLSNFVTISNRYIQKYKANIPRYWLLVFFSWLHKIYAKSFFGERYSYKYAILYLSHDT